MDLYKFAGLEYGYESKKLPDLLNSYPVARKTLDQGKQLRSYSPVAVFAYRERGIRYTLKTEGKEYLRFHFHVESESVWDIHCGPPVKPLDWDIFRERPMLLRKRDGEMGAMVYVHDTEVLPGTITGDPIRVQVTGYPRAIQVMEGPEGGVFVMGDPLDKEDGANVVMEPGVFWPIGVNYHLVYNRDSRWETRQILHRAPDLMDNMLFAKILRIQALDIPGDPRLVYVETQYGELGIFLETLEELSEEQRALLRPGSYLYADLNLDGIVAFGTREDGMILDRTEDLRAMRTVMKSRCAANTYALLPLLADDVVYFSQYNHAEYHGIREVMMKIKSIMEFTTMNNEPVELTEVTKAGPDSLYPCREGTPCLALSYGDEGVSSLLFFELKEDQLIHAIHVVDYKGYEIRTGS